MKGNIPMTIEEKMHNGMLYPSGMEELSQASRDEWMRCKRLLHAFNQSSPDEMERRTEYLRDVFASTDGDFYVEPPLHANWGCHTHIGKNFYANFNLTLVDDTDIFIGDNVMFAPNVVLTTGTHPISPELRAQAYQYNLSIRIGNGVWLGAGVIVLPGVTIGENSVIGAGSVVTHDIPANVVAVGSPCRVLRPITERDRQFYRHDMPIQL